MPKIKIAQFFKGRGLLPKVATLLGVFFLVGTILVSSVLGFEYYSANKLFAEGEGFLAAQKYDEAIIKFTLAKARWSSRSLKDRIELSLQKSAVLKASLAHYLRGVTLFDEGKWAEAVEELTQVIKDDSNYQEAQRLIANAEEKIGSVAGAETAVPIPKPTPIPTPIPTPTPVPNGKEVALREIDKKISDINQKISRLNAEIDNLLQQERQCDNAMDPYSCSTSYFASINQIEAMKKPLIQERNELERQRIEILSR